MDQTLLKYWKICLQDAERKAIAPKGARITLNIGDKILKFVPLKSIPVIFPDWKAEDSNEKQKVMIAPCILLPEFENGWTSQSERPEYPFLITATMLPDGKLTVCENESDRIPIFIRKFLEPNAANDRTIASLSKVDQLLSNFNTEETKWEAYWQACEQLFKKATGKTFSTMNYYDNPEIIIIKASERNMAQPIITLYDKLLKDNDTTPHPLLNLLIQTKPTNVLPSPTTRKVYCNREHWAQMSGDFPLSVSQRETLAMYTTPECTDIFVVNGPPGTGKTTFLQTVIANRLAHNILNNPEEPEIIVASSANNQAITNILKDFKAETTNDTTHPRLSNRWLPELDTLGLYLSGKKELQQQYKMMFNPMGDGFPATYDTPERQEEYKNFYLQCFNNFFGKAYQDETKCQQFLRKEMQALQKKIIFCIQAAETTEYGNRKENNILQKFIRKFHEPLPSYDKVIEQWALTEEFKERYEKISSNPEYGNLPYTEDMAVRLDISYRYQMFWYAIHYREAEFIHRLSKCDEGKQRTQEAYTQRLKRLACVMPVFISTFHSLPKYMTYAENGKWDVPLYNGIDLLIVDESGQVSPELAVPSFSLAKQAILVGDIQQIEPVWSISDEYSFINLKNLGIVSNQSSEKYRFLENNGFLSSSGSIMKLARKSCNFTVKGEKGAFLTEHRRCVDSIIAYCNDYVYHGRLLPKKGNEVKYKSLPSKGYVHINSYSSPGKTGSRLNRAEAEAIVCWLELEKDNLEKTYKKPIHEIVAVVTPFKAQEAEIRHQIQKISGNEKYKDMIIGTVHSLQGAQCPIVLFSTVNSPEDHSLFMERDGKYNMLNVAISRAQHHFIVFGNMNIFHPEENTPVGNMAKWLFDDPSNEISNNFIYQQEVPLCTYHPTLRLSTTEEHIQVLHQAFEKARHRLLIVSPFISIHAIENDQLVPLIRHTVQRGVDVTVYTDSSLDYDTKTNQLLSRAEEGRNILIENGATLIEVKGIHNKSLAIDNHTLIEGSFNWLSANRHKEYSRHECSIIVSSFQADEYINNLIKELESREKTFQSLSKTTIYLDIDQKHPGFFTKESFNDCTEEDICRIKQKVQELGIQKTVLPPYIHKQRETFPRAYEPWCTEEKEIICELMQKTNHLSIFIECLQRTGQAIQIQIEGKNN